MKPLWEDCKKMLRRPVKGIGIEQGDANSHEEKSSWRHDCGGCTAESQKGEEDCGPTRWVIQGMLFVRWVQRFLNLIVHFFSIFVIVFKSQINEPGFN